MRKSMLFWLLFLECFVVVQGILSYQAGTCTEAQMLQQHLHGLPFIWQGAMWGDFFILSPLATWMIVRFSSQWKPASIFRSTMFGAVVSSLLHWTYCADDLTTAHVIHHVLTPVGWVHGFYAAIIVTVITLFVVSTCTNKREEFFAFATLGVFLGSNFIEPAVYLGQDLLNKGTATEVCGTGAAFMIAIFYKRRSKSPTCTSCTSIGK